MLQSRDQEVWSRDIQRSGSIKKLGIAGQLSVGTGIFHGSLKSDPLCLHSVHVYFLSSTFSNLNYQ